MMMRLLGGVLVAVFLSITMTGGSLAQSAGMLIYDRDTDEYRVVSSRRGGAVPAAFRRKMVKYDGNEKAGTIVVDTKSRFLFHVQGQGKAMRYGIGVGREGFTWKGTQRVTRKAEWPSWTPPKEMIAREAAAGRTIPPFMEGGPENPMGSRALYLGNTLYRIHGTNNNWSIGRAVSSGCIRMANKDVEHLYERVKIGARVIVR